MKIARPLLAGALLGAILAAPAQADIAARYQTNDENAVMKMEITVEADDEGNVRTQMARLGAYFLLRDGVVYQVANSKSDPFVVRVSDLMVLQAEVSKEMFGDLPTDIGPPKQMYAPMANEMVGERNGTGYGIVSEEYPEPRYASIVISDDPALAQLGDALVTTNKAMVNSMPALGPMGTMLGQMNAEMLAVLEKGAPLRMLSLELTDVSGDEIPPERFELPAEPLTIDQLRELQTPQVDEPPTLPPADG